MKRIVLCLDGTWNEVRKPDDVTNVVKIAQAVRSVATAGVQQIVYYNSGVGTGDLIDKMLGGVFGRGLRSNVQRAYAFLSLNYEPGDQIFIFGFSRGAYTARALAGVIGTSGILRKDQFQNSDIAWYHYRLPAGVRARFPRGADKALLAHLPKALRAYAEFDEEGKFHRDVKVTCVGVWDTVGSYGVPAGFGFGAISRIFTAWLLRGFRDTEIGKHIEIGLHAVGLDEKRRPFAPTFWTIKRGAQPVGHVEQVWFVGSHGNVGGGYDEAGLSDRSLIWMCARGRARRPRSRSGVPQGPGETIAVRPAGARRAGLADQLAVPLQPQGPESQCGQGERHVERGGSHPGAHQRDGPLERAGAAEQARAGGLGRQADL
jgi:hypothetical protein